MQKNQTNNPATKKKQQIPVHGSNGNGTAKKSERKTPGEEKSLEDLLEGELKDIYSAEKQLLIALPDIAKAAESEDLYDELRNSYEETKRQIERLEKVFDRLQISVKDLTICKPMEGLISEAKKIMEEYKESPVRDSALIIVAQKIKHYEIAAYGSLCELSDVLGYHKIHDILGRTLDEEEVSDCELSDIAMEVNDDAYEMSEHSFEY